MPQWSSRLLSSSPRFEQAGQKVVIGNSTPNAQIQQAAIESRPAESLAIPGLPNANTNNNISVSSLTSASSSHVRSISNPFPSFFSGKKKRFADTPTNVGATGIESTDQDKEPPITNRNSSTSKAPKQKFAEKDFVTGKCMTCDSNVRWPKELNIFRCTVCMTINDLKPIKLENRHEDNQRIPVSGTPRADSGPQHHHHHYVYPLSLETTKNIIENCIAAYLISFLSHSSVPCLSPSEHTESNPNTIDSSERRPEAIKLEKKSKIHTCITGSTLPHNEKGDNQIKVEDLQENSLSNLQRIESTSHSMGQSAGKYTNQKVKEFSQKPPSPHYINPRTSYEGDGTISRPKADISSKNLFEPLEEYIVKSFGSFECVNYSFNTVRPVFSPRAASEGSKCVLPISSPTSNQLVPETEISEMDAKTLLLGDFAENGSWWTGNRTNSNVREDPSMRRELTGIIRGSKDSVNSKSPRIDWVETNEWYHIVLQAGRSWRRSLDFLTKSSPKASKLRKPTEQELDQIEDELSDARYHTQRVLLKVTETLLKRPGRPLTTPNDLRFLLIILANPLLYTTSSTPRGKQRIRSRSKSPPRGPTNGTKGTTGQHSGIIKRILGLLSNVSSECHRHLVSWFSRYSESQFQRTTDLINNFVMYRLLRQQGRKNNVEQDPTAGLIPNISGTNRNSSAALHAALGVVGKVSKKSDNNTKTFFYGDDWQIKAAAKVMSLLFSANNSGLKRDGQAYVGLERAQSIGVAIREKAFYHGQIIPTSNFYISLLDCSDLIADFEAWESRSGRFSFCQYPFFLSIWAKIQIMEYDTRRQMEVKAREAFFDSIMTRKTVNQYLFLSVRRDCLIEDSLKAISEVVGTGGEEIKKGLRITFKGEEGIDAGGLRKEWFLLLVRDVFNPEHGMFTYDEDSRMCYFNPHSFETSDQFFLVGVILGLAIYNSTILDVALPPFAFRKLLAASPSPAPGAATHTKPSMTYSLDDLAQYRPSLANGLRQLLEYDGDVESTFLRDFVADFNRYGQVVQVPLCPDGENRTVTNANRREFVELYVRYLLDTAVTRQFEPFKRGFFTVCGGNALSLFRPEEIELLIRGSDEPLDITSLRAVCECENWGNHVNPGDEPVLDWFWETFESSRPNDQRKLLSFVTGSDRIPAMGATNLIIKLSCAGDDENRFPVARTCFNQLSLPRYSSKQRLESMLWRAVIESEGFGLK
ncbi:BgTH12-03613 [Blumeria graminis f. sp. triticale]|uniref:HECT-type E3 ubiquitin transferase n=3 Tax=Blumeria graminis TaxID=34373 RepID=A0A061HAZ1_BLUGR|nr:hypothetical protein BGT96224_3291 [Blumeria graminis f. sp. tritici 96224]CAD6499501.1 BgTH12-03613 [Blumeria graminis f. sp. triticale]VCU39670.1 Bgt-3291 [Blumeria graminis f. sp. tritici]